jgi:hypothetical protein
MTNGRFARKPIAAIFSGWTTIRVGLYMLMNDSGASIAGTPRLAFGLCSGTTNIPGDATCTHFAGFCLNIASLTRTATPARYGLGAAAFPTKLVNTTFTFGTQFTASGTANIYTNVLQMLFVDITVGSPNYSFNCFFPSGGATAPTNTLSDFTTQMITTTPAFANYTYSAAQTVAVNEGTNGVFDSACVWWNQATPTVDIAAWEIYRIA